MGVTHGSARVQPEPVYIAGADALRTAEPDGHHSVETVTECRHSLEVDNAADFVDGLQTCSA